MGFRNPSPLSSGVVSVLCSNKDFRRRGTWFLITLSSARVYTRALVLDFSLTLMRLRLAPVLPILHSSAVCLYSVVPKDYQSTYLTTPQPTYLVPTWYLPRCRDAFTSGSLTCLLSLHAYCTFPPVDTRERHPGEGEKRRKDPWEFRVLRIGGVGTLDIR